MGGLLVVIAVAVFYDEVVNVIATVTDFLWEEIGYPLLTEIMAIFGIKDKDIIATQVVTQRLIPDDSVYTDMMTKLALDHQNDPDSSPIQYFVDSVQDIKVKYNGYIGYGRTTSAGLPETTFRVFAVNPRDVKIAIDDDYNINCTILTSMKETLSKEQWASSVLQESHDYKPYNNTMVVDGLLSDVTSIEYDYDDNVYQIGYENFQVLTTTVTTTTDITITSTDDDTIDNKNTVVTEQTVIVSDVNGDVSDDTVELSNTDEDIDAGSEEDSTSSTEEVTEETVINVQDFIQIASYEPLLYITAKYYTTTEDEWYWWVYDIESNTRPTITDEDLSYTGMELLPVVELRSNSVSVTADKSSAKYKEGKEILDIIGMDIDNMVDSIEKNPDIAKTVDAYVHFSINLSDSSDGINKLVYETFATLFEDSDLLSTVETVDDADDGSVTTKVTTSSGYYVTIAEGNYNNALAWKTQERRITAEVIGDVGTYSKSISGDDLYLTKQVTPTSTATYIMYGVTAVTVVKRGGMAGSVGKDLAGGIEVPLAFFYLDRLTPLEQTLLYPSTLKLSTYAADITHIKWYKTKAFALLVQVVAIIIAIILTVLAQPTAAMQVLMLAASLAIGYGVKLAFKWIANSGLAPWLKAVLYAIVIVIAIYAGQAVSSGEFPGAEQFLTAVTEQAPLVGAQTVSYGSQAWSGETAVKMQELQDKRSAWSHIADERTQEQEAAWDELNTGLDYWDVEDLAVNNDFDPYRGNVEAWRFAQGPVQYEFGMLKCVPDSIVHDYYDNKFAVIA